MGNLTVISMKFEWCHLLITTYLPRSLHTCKIISFLYDLDINSLNTLTVDVVIFIKNINTTSCLKWLFYFTTIKLQQLRLWCASVWKHRGRTTEHVNFLFLYSARLNKFPSSSTGTMKAAWNSEIWWM